MFVIQSFKVLSKRICKVSLQFTLAMFTNSFEAGEHEDAVEVSQISSFDCNGCKR